MERPIAARGASGYKDLTWLMTKFKSSVLPAQYPLGV